MSKSFIQFLIESEEPEGEVKLFNPMRFVPKLEQVFNLMLKAASSKAEPMNDLIILEMLSVFKEVLVNRLEPYKNKNYKERKDDKGDIATIKAAEEEIKAALIEVFNEQSYRSGINKFMTLVVAPILSEIERVSPAKAAHRIDSSSFKYTAQDSFGALMKLIINSKSFGNDDDAKVAKKTLDKLSVTAKKESKKTRRLTKGQRLKLIRQAAEKVQDR